MPRAPQTTSEPIPVAPGNSVYTVLAIIGFIAGLLGLGVIWLRASALGVQLF